MNTLTSFAMVCVLVCFFESTKGREVYVNVTYTGVGSPTGKLNDPYTTIQDALDDTFHGDVIIVYPGTYTGIGNTNLNFANQVDLRALDLTNRPIFDLAGTSFGVWNPYLPNSTAIGSFFGLVFINGVATGSSASVLEVRNGSLNIVQCDFNSNKAVDGGAVVLTTSSSGDPGGSLVTFEKCNFYSNQANNGAAIQALYNKNRKVVIQNCVFSSNTAQVSGGAVYSDHVSLLISRSTFSSNSAATQGGAVFAGTTGKLMGRALHVVVLHSTFTSNTAGAYGGAISVLNDGELDMSYSQITSNILSATSGSQGGAGVYVSGSVVFDTVTMQSNLCSYSAESYGGGLGLDPGNSSTASFIRSSTFQSNGCQYGSDLSVLSGSLYASEIKVNRNTAPFQITAGGTALVRIVDGQFTDKTSDTLHSLLVTGAARLSLEFTKTDSYLLKIVQLFMEEQGVLESTSHLTVSQLFFNGGNIQSTTTSSSLTFTITESGMVGEDAVSTSPLKYLTGFIVANNGTLIIGKTDVLYVTDYFYNNDQLYLQEKATISAIDGGNIVSFYQRGEIYVNSTAYLNCNFYDEPGSLLVISNIGVSSSESLIILGGTSLEGNLKLSFSSDGVKTFDSGEKMRIIRYLELFRSPFTNIISIPTRTIYSEYGVADFYISNHKSGSSDGGGLDGGDVAGIVIAVIIGLGGLTLAAWYFIIRPQNEQLYQEEVFAHTQQTRETPGPSAEGYGAL